ELIDKQVGKLSGGELQRVLLTMAVMDYPNLLVMDEPVSGIDRNGMELFYQNIEYLKKNYDMAIILISHDLEYVESEKVLKMFREVAVIDHHRRAVEGAVTDTVLSFHEPGASSCSEMVTELTENIKNCRLNKMEAQVLLAGIILDTKNFTERTGARTFEAAANLRKAGADPQDVRGYFKNDLKSYRKQIEIISNAEMVTERIAVSAWEDAPFDGIKIIAAKAADELLNMSNISGAFVLYQEGDLVHISGRSDANYNVQTILEQMGGGGHRSSAGAQIKEKSLQEVRKELTEIILKEEKEGTKE
ncbi:MAG: DHH family phosphoesterase, partial [Clostridia bacterium]|nr:DHH family phosphoesterase [Clostridia bacterium]